MPDEALAIIEPAATRVRDPLSGRSVWLAGLIKHPRIDGETLQFTLACSPDHSAEDRNRMRDALIRNIESLGWKGPVVCHLAVSRRGAAPRKESEPVRGMSGPGVQPHGGPISKKPLVGVKNIIAVASGKGGVGKSTVATNLAVALARSGHSVGLVDADIYGPSLPLMMNVRGRPFANADRKIIPLEAYGVRCMSIGFLVDDTEPIIWRGPMVMGVVRQFLQEVAWGDLDVLIIDLPPGTGDAQLTMIQAVPLQGAVVVTTPQPVAVRDAVRAIEMFRKLDVPVLGIVENMAWMELPDGKRIHPFGRGGGEATAERYQVPLLAQVPLDGHVREGGDEGRPVALEDDGPATVFAQMASAIATQLADR